MATMLSIVQCFVPSFIGVTGVRMLLGAASSVCYNILNYYSYYTPNQGASSVGWVLVCECVTSKGRSFTLSLIGNIAWVVGYMIIGVLAMTVDTWRHQLLFATSPFCVIAVVYIWYFVMFMVIAIIHKTC
jgi:hypothetical protein